MKIITIEERIKPYLPHFFTVWMLLVGYLTLTPPDLLTSAAKMGDPKLGHVILFGGWTALLGLLLIINRGRKEQPLWIIFTAGVVFGAIIELMQFVLPYGRTGSWADIGFNTIGCTLAIIFLAIYKKIRYNNDVKSSD